jgi:Zn-dependent M16 (insulinase) family peptidase
MMKAGDIVHGFRIESVEDLGELKATGIFARHVRTGLEAFHILNDDEENLFAYAFMTPPEDSTGVAHIIEHSVLCGSERYPLKDPFLVLAKQSVKTFLNAMTFPDKTVYPASSMVEADYFNLMSVYGDAVFFPLLEEWVFRQEGHRFEVGDDGKLSIQGVVFNEMRGNYSSFDSIAGDWSLKSILPGSIYAFDSGGDPAEIPDLTYERFRAFHARYYHPANCRVFLAGNIPTERQFALLDEKFLSRFGTSERPAPIEAVAHFDAPRALEVPAPAGSEQDLSKATVMVNWLFPDSTDTVALMEANLVSEVLLGHDGAPLSKALLESGFGEDIAPSSGLETEIRHMCFSVGLRGVERSRAEAAGKFILCAIEQIATGGIAAEEIETAVRSIDFGNREVRRSDGPFALTLMRRSLRGWIHGLGPTATLRYVPAFEEVKRRIAADPAYVTRLITAWFIENRHRALVTVYPDRDYERRLEEQLANRVSAFESSLDGPARERLLSAQRELNERQRTPDPEDLLERIPHLRKSDLPVVADSIQTEFVRLGTLPALLHEQPTNGIAYADLAIPVDVIQPAEYPLLPFFASVLTGCGLGSLSWAEASALAARCTGGLGTMLFTSSTVKGSSMDPVLGRDCAERDFLIVRVKMLSDFADEAIALAFKFIREADFSDTKRLVDLLLEYRNDLDSSLAPGGNQFAVSRASATTGRSRAVDELWNGLSQVRFVRDLSSAVRTKGERERLVSRLDAIRARLLESGMIVNLTGTREILDAMSSSIARHAASFTAPRARPAYASDLRALFALTEPATETALQGAPSAEAGKIGDAAGNIDPSAPWAGPSLELVSANLQVGFAAAVLPSPEYGTSEHPADIVFGHWLANGLLWEKIRTTGGAYGAFAYPDSLENVFVLATYRDPTPCDSLDAFRDALAYAAEHPVDPVSLEKTITGCYSREIQPRSPADRGFTAFIRILYGISDEVRKGKVAGIVSVTPEDLTRCARRLLGDWPVAREAVLAGKKQLKGGMKSEFPGKVIRYTV